MFAAGVEPDEAAEYPLAFRFGDTGAVVADRYLNGTVACDSLDPDVVPGVPDGVVQHIAEHPVQQMRVTLGRHASRRAQLDGDRARGGSCTHLGEQVRDVDALSLGDELLVVCSGEQQELLDERFQPFCLPDGAAGDVRPRRLIPVGQGDLEGGADRGERAAQFV